MPRFRDSLVIPGAEVTTAAKSRPLGIRSMISACTFAPATFCLTSMSGDSAVTLTFSETPPTASARSILSTWPSSSRTSEDFAG